MAWQRTSTLPTGGVAETGLCRSGTWTFRGLYRVFAWPDGAPQIAWVHEFPDEVGGEGLLAATERIAVVASFQSARFQTDFVALDIATGAVRWQRSRRFCPANRRNAQSLACDDLRVTCLGSDEDRRFSMLRFDLASGDIIDERVLDVRHDVAIAAGGRSFVGGGGGLFVFDRDRLEPILDGEIVELEPFGADLLVHVRDPENQVLSWLTPSGESKGHVILDRELGVLRPTAASAGRVIVMPQYQPGVSLYDLASSQLVWTTGVEQQWEGHRAAVVDGRVLVHIEQPKRGFAIVALDEAAGTAIESPLDKIGSVQLFSGTGQFVLSFLQRLDVYAWV